MRALRKVSVATMKSLLYCVLNIFFLVLRVTESTYNAMPLKYQNEIEEVRKTGCSCPPDGLEAINALSYRYVFEDPQHPNNHKPVGKNSPKRVLNTKDEKKCTLFSLSCFADKNGAINFFWELKKNIPNFEKSVGNLLHEGIITEDDGLTTTPEYYTHFELFEYIQCNLSVKFTLSEKLV